MHIAEGVLSAPVLITGAVLTITGTYYGIKKLDNDKIPETAVLTSSFFIASLIHIPFGPSSVHLILNGLLGILLGEISFPAILIALILQATFFQFGGFLVLGVNTFNMAFPSLIIYFLNKRLKVNNKIFANILYFFYGSFSVLLSAILVGFSLYFTGEEFINVSKILIIAHLPVMIIEGIVTIIVINFLKNVKPSILE